MEISDIYKSLRLLKSKLKKDSEGNEIKDEEFWDKVEELDRSYSDVLKRYENHDPIDTEVFKASRPKYEDHNLNWFQVQVINGKSYISNILLYHLTMILPPIVFIFVTFYIK